jgi:hypothetical protein
MLILALSGQAQVGKDSTADHLVKNHNFLKISLADPIKRYAMSMFDLSYDQLWGDLKDKLDVRYPRICGHGHRELKDCEICVKQPDCFSPREFVQFLGTEFGRRFYPNIWLDMLFRELTNHYLKMEISWNWKYYPERGFEYEENTKSYPEETYDGVVIPDIRFINEINYMEAKGVQLWRIKRPGLFVNSEVAKHSSESEQLSVPDSRFKKLINNDSTIEDLYFKIDEIYYPMYNRTII